MPWDGGGRFSLHRGRIWPRQGEECVAGLSLRVAVQPGVKVSSEVCRKLGCLVGIMGEVSAQTCWHLCPRQPGPRPALPEHGLRATAGAQTSPRQVPGSLLLGPSISWPKGGCWAPRAASSEKLQVSLCSYHVGLGEGRAHLVK